MKELSTTILEIESLAAGGDGVGKIDGKITFVSGLVPGDRAIVRVVGSKKRMLRAEVVELREHGPGRRSVRCPFFAECGGCQWLHINEDVQRAAKKSFLERAIGIPVPDVIPSPRSTGYRRLVRLRLEGSPGKNLGFNAKGSARVVDIPMCEVLEPGLNRALADLRESLVSKCNLSCEIKLAGGDFGVAASFVAGEMFDPGFYQKAESIVPDSFSGVTTEVDSLFAVVAGSPEVVVAGADGKPLIMPVGSFGQANAEVNLVLGETVCEWVREGNYKSAVELFAGAGNLSVGLADSLKKLATVELDHRAVVAARRNISERKLRGVTIYEGEALDVYDKVGSKAELVILDPPRTGHAKLAERLASAKHRAIIYVSCDPGTLGRDLENMGKGGYKPVRAIGFDMFPQTPHLEAAVLLERVQENGS